ncbi:MAG: TIGR04282 family arsenosugar biosynthesis glycosyltransferase [Nitrospirae bacterium]|nr:TIGR04282 family arsenosugar biosynthesis glycosyltransferase [Nitrospirota bacterium]
MKALIIFVKAPVLGTVKTRLQPSLGAEETLKLYKSFVTEIVSKCAGLKGIAKFLGCSPSRDGDFIQRLAGTHEFESFDQRGKNLGEKIVNAFRDYFKKGYTEIVLIGSDSPTIPAEYIKLAFSELRKNDFVIGPCCDGGMYLVGAKKKIMSEIFRNITWDTGEVLNKVLKKTNSLNVRYSLLPFWYDIDTIEDLNFLANHRRYLERKLRVKS